MYFTVFLPTSSPGGGGGGGGKGVGELLKFSTPKGC